jgi:23S rRNA pseudouridine2605 synthase
MAKVRLQKVLVAAGVDSRRNCEELILEGAVRVNGRVVDTIPAFVDPEQDVITVHGRKIREAQKVYFLLNKPKGVICTSYDPQGRRRVIDLVPTRQRIFCVGRLDVDTTGLIILTNDNELANKLTHPRYEVAKTYVAAVGGRADAAAVAKLKKGVWLADGKTSPAKVAVLRQGPRESLIEITIHEGLNRQVRRMLANVDLPVKSLKRTQIGKISSKGLGVGKFRLLGHAEVAYLKKITSL